MTRNSQGTVDPLDFTEVLERQKSPGFKLTFIVPTDVNGSTESALMTLRNQLREAKRVLLEHDHTEAKADACLAPVAALADDSAYWRQRSRSLVIFLADEFFQAMRVPIELGDSLTIDEHFNLLPLAPVIASDRKLYVLALARNSVRLFETSRNVIEELPLENIPKSFDDVIGEIPVRNIDVRAGTGGVGRTASFQGQDRDIDRQVLEQYIRAIGQALGQRLGTARSQMLVLASVAEYLPYFKESSSYPAVFDGVIAGNSDRALPNDLRSAAWQLVEGHEAARDAEELDQAHSLVHAGKGELDLAEIARAAEAGRVDTLFLPRNDATIADPQLHALANRALIGTLENSGTVRTLGTMEGSALATFRY